MQLQKQFWETMLETANAFVSSNELTMMDISRASRPHDHIYCYHLFSITKIQRMIMLFSAHYISCAKFQHILLKHKSEQEGENEKNGICTTYHVWYERKKKLPILFYSYAMKWVGY
jgi:hypothetical protein